MSTLHAALVCEAGRLVHLASSSGAAASLQPHPPVSLQWHVLKWILCIKAVGPGRVYQQHQCLETGLYQRADSVLCGWRCAAVDAVWGECVRGVCTDASSTRDDRYVGT